MICAKVTLATWAKRTTSGVPSGTARPWCGRAWYGSAPPRGTPDEVQRKALVTVTGRTHDETCAMLDAAVKVIIDRENDAPERECAEWIVSHSDQQSTRCQFGGCRCGRTCR